MKRGSEEWGDWGPGRPYLSPVLVFKKKWGFGGRHGIYTGSFVWAHLKKRFYECSLLPGLQK